MNTKLITILLLLIIIIYCVKDIKREREMEREREREREKKWEKKWEMEREKEKIYISNSSSSKKIAFCFLIYDKINNEKIWYDYINCIDKNKYNIYIHYKKNKPLKYFEKYKIKNTINTSWGGISIVLAQIEILKNALKDPYNQHFIWLSQACIPIKSFNYIYNNLDINKSYYNISPNSQLKNKTAYIQKYIKKENIKKAGMPSIINRKHAYLFVSNKNNIMLCFRRSKLIADEIIFITLLHHYNLRHELILTPNISAGAIIFTGWTDMKNYKKFNKSKLTKTTPNEYKYICKDELHYLLSSKSMFARKFVDNCKGLEKLIKYLV